MNRKKKYLSEFIDFLIPRDCGIQVGAFHILALCGVIVCVITAIYNLALGLGAETVFESAAGIIFSLGLMVYTRKTGDYRRAMILTVLVIFIGLFTLLFISGGGYHSGVPSFSYLGWSLRHFYLTALLCRFWS